MKKTILIIAATSVITLVYSSTVIAKPGAYVSVEGGYSDLDFPKGDKISNLTFLIDSGDIITALNTNKFDAHSNHSFFNVHVGYLFPIRNHFSLGPQVGVSYYGSINMTNKKVNPDPGAKGSIKETFYSMNLYLVGNYDFGRYFIRGKAGAIYALGLIKNDYGLPVNNINFYNKGVDSYSGLIFASGIEVGAYITKNIALALSYSHIFAKKYSFDDLNEIGDYTKTSTFRMPSANLIGLGIIYTF